MRGYMKVTNCMVIVWLLYGYCVVRMVKIVVLIHISCKKIKFQQH